MCRGEGLSNLFFELEQQKFRFNKFEGLNKKRNAKSQIKFVGEFDEFTISTVYENYEVISKNLQVYPSITIYDRSRQLDGGFSGFYHSSNHHIEMVDHYFIISILTHEMRHAFQYIYFPSLYYESEYSTARQYLDCKVERDAREYAIAYCEANGLHEEKQALVNEERQIELVIKKKLSPSAVGLDDQYFRENPQIAHSHNQEDGEYHYEESTESTGGFSRFVKGIAGIVILLALSYNFFFDNDEEEKMRLSNNQEQYVLENSATEYLIDEDLNELSKEQLRIARNEIYARHGFIFGAEDLKEYFSNQLWYSPDPEFTDDFLSELEHLNISIIQSYEK